MAPQHDPYLGTEILGQYRLEKKLGEGGMGIVYLADQPAMARKAAIKILRPEIASEEQMQRFQREAQTLSQIDHRHIIKVYNFGTLDQGELYIAMEFVRGREMDQILEEEGRMDWRRAVDITIQAADALVDAHSKGIIHRDLKPENVMLCERRDSADFVKVMDFGIAKVLENSQELESSSTIVGVIHGTPMYMSPEQARGEAVDARSDIYSLAIVLYAMLTRELPIKSNTLVGYIIAHQQDPPEPLNTYGVEVPKRLEAILWKMLEKKLEDRYQSMQEVLNDLQALVAPPPAKSQKRLIGLLVALIMTLSGAGLAVYLLGVFDPKTPVVTTGLPPGVVEASDNKAPRWIKRPPPTSKRTFVVGKAVSAIKSEARDQAMGLAAAKLLRKASGLLLDDDLETSALKHWLKAARKSAKEPAGKRLLIEAVGKGSFGPKLSDSDSDYWELRRPKSGSSQYHYWRLFSYPVGKLRHLNQQATKYKTYYGMRAIPLYPLIAPAVGATEGIILSKVKKGGVAHRTGVRQEDVVLRVNGQRVKSPKDFASKAQKAVSSGKRSGEPMRFDLVRLERGKPKKHTIEITKFR